MRDLPRDRCSETIPAHAPGDRGRPGRDPAQRRGCWPSWSAPRRGDDRRQGRRLRPRNRRVGARGPRRRARAGSASPPWPRRSRSARPATPAGSCAGSRSRPTSTDGIAGRSRPTSTSRRTPWDASTRSSPRRSPCPRVQLKVDTGLSRGGAAPGRLAGSGGRAAEHERAGRPRITGVWSHFACSDEPDHPANDLQEQRFRDALAVAEEAGLRPRCATSPTPRPRSCGPAVPLRPGAVAASRSTASTRRPATTPDLDLRPAMTVRAPLALAKRIAAGEGVSYGHTWVADEATTVGLVPARVRRRRAAPRQQRVGGRGRRRTPTGPRAGVHGPARGRPRRGPAAVGDEVVLFGPGDHGEPTAQDWAEACGTISYEIVTRIGGRLRTPLRKETRSEHRPSQSSGSRPAPSASPRPVPRCASPSAAAVIARRGVGDQHAVRLPALGSRSRWSPTTACRCTSRSTSSTPRSSAARGCARAAGTPS